MMGDVTKIQWADHTASPWKVDGDELFPNVLFHDRCKMWNYHAGKANRIGTVEIEVDLFEDHEKHVDAAILREGVFGVIDECQNLHFLLLTKRPQNVRKMWPENRTTVTASDDSRFTHRSNVAIIASVSDQQTADEMVPHLLRCRDLVPWLGVSAEPLLGPIEFAFWTEEEISFHNHKWAGRPEVAMADQIDLVIIGGESGPHARPYNVEWIRSIVRQCRDAGVSCYLKQVGSKPYENANNGPSVRSWGESVIQRNGEFVQIHLKDKKGGNPAEWPADLQVRQLPWEGVK